MLRLQRLNLASCLMFALLGLSPFSHAGNPAIINFDPLGSINTQVTAINDAGTIVGCFWDTQGEHGFSRAASGLITVIDIAGPSSETCIYSINNNGEMAGFYYSDGYLGFILDGYGNLTTFSLGGAAPLPTSLNTLGLIAGTYVPGLEGVGFTRDAAGDITTFVPFNALAVGSAYIDTVGRIAGNYTDAEIITHGYLRDEFGNFTSFDAPGAGTDAGRGTFVASLTAVGEIAAGYYTDEEAVGHGFIRSYSGKFTVFEVPGSGRFASEGTYVTAINASVTVAGSYVDISYVSHGFMRDGSGNITTFDDPNGGSGFENGTFPVAINSSGQIAGNYTNSTSNAGHGFLRNN
jgi:hypothetical protein